MNLLPHSPIKMDYSPVTDILTVEYPDLDAALLPIVKESLMVMVGAINDYHIKRLLLNASQTKVLVSAQESRDMTMALATELAKTRLERLARVQPADPERELQAQANIEKVKQLMPLPYKLQTFTNKPEAIKWLREASTLI